MFVANYVQIGSVIWMDGHKYMRSYKQVYSHFLTDTSLSSGEPNKNRCFQRKHKIKFYHHTCSIY